MVRAINRRGTARQFVRAYVKVSAMDPSIVNSPVNNTQCAYNVPQDTMLFLLFCLSPPLCFDYNLGVALL